VEIRKQFEIKRETFDIKRTGKISPVNLFEFSTRQTKVDQRLLFLHQDKNPIKPQTSFFRED
jgi:hypothetical protein